MTKSPLKNIQDQLTALANESSLAATTFKKDIRVVAVSKLQSVSAIQDVYNQGQRIFGENYVQEALPKIDSLKDLKIEWHFIGRLQKNKVKQVVGTFSLIHSVDSVDLLTKINDVAQKLGIRQKVLLQVNLSNEPTKGGFSSEDVLLRFSEMRTLEHVEILGLMTMPPLDENPSMVRPYFKRLRELQQKLVLQEPSCVELSMGTSHDYLVAAQEGSTMVRLGTILFGSRPLVERTNS